MKRALIYEGFRSSGLGSLIEKQSFENFSLGYYNGADLEKMEYNLAAAKDFAESFSEDSSENLLLLGGTGLGKTHISTAIAKRIIERGYDVLYDSAQNMITAFEQDRFHRGYGDDSPYESEKYFSSDLLIIDDLGTEIANSFSVSCLYNVINTRINKGKPIVINTNMNQKIMLSRYDERISSRLLGEFRILLFTGEDIRKQKASL
jgi:DNA replication protein DnaC